jgi:hypothetical protein
MCLDKPGRCRVAINQTPSKTATALPVVSVERSKRV